MKSIEKYKLHDSTQDFRNAVDEGCHFCNIGWASLILRPQILQHGSPVAITMQIELKPPEKLKANLFLKLSFDGPAPIGKVPEAVGDIVARDVMIRGWQTPLTRENSMWKHA